jgi:hypothetical protein
MKNIVEIKKTKEGGVKINFKIIHKFGVDEKETLIYSKTRTFRPGRFKNHDEIKVMADALVDVAVAAIQKKLE